MAKEFARHQRMSQLLQRELAVIIQRETKDPRLGLVTISDVEVSPDLAYAKVFVTVFNIPEQQIPENIKLLNKMNGFFRGLLGKRIKARIIPELKFIYDTTIIEGNRLAKIIDEVVTKEDVSSDRDDSESDEQDK